MKKMLLSTATAVALAAGALSFGTTDASATYYGYQSYHVKECYTEWRTVKVRYKVWSKYYYKYIYKYRYVQKPFKVCH